MAVFELPLAAAKFVILAGLSACPQAATPKVDVILTPKDNPYITDVSAQNLTSGFSNQQRMQDTLGSHANEGRWMTGGLAAMQMNGGVKGTVSVLTDRKTGNSCLSLNSLTLNITHEATIHVASDYQKMGCRFSQTIAHERRHVQFERMAITRNIPALKRALLSYARTTGSQGPYAAGEVAAQQQRIFDGASQAIAPIISAIIEEQRASHARIDNYENYTKESAMCPGQFPKFDGAADTNGQQTP